MQRYKAISLRCHAVALCRSINCSEHREHWSDRRQSLSCPHALLAESGIEERKSHAMHRNAICSGCQVYAGPCPIFEITSQATDQEFMPRLLRENRVEIRQGLTCNLKRRRGLAVFSFIAHFDRVGFTQIERIHEQTARCQCRRRAINRMPNGTDVIVGVNSVCQIMGQIVSAFQVAGDHVIWRRVKLGLTRSEHRVRNRKFTRHGLHGGPS